MSAGERIRRVARVAADRAAGPISSEDDLRLVGATRLVLAVTGFLIVALIPAGPNEWRAATYSVLVANTLYAAGVHWFAAPGSRFHRWFFRWGHWVDVGWFTLLITVSSGANSIFFFGYFFCIVVASFRWGFASGIRVTLTSTLLFTTLGYAGAVDAADLELQRFLYRPVSLLVVGYMVASRGGLEMTLRERLKFLRDVGTMTNARAGLDRTISFVMRRLLEFYAADACALVTTGGADDGFALRLARRADPRNELPAESIPDPLGKLLLRFPGDGRIAYSGRDRVKVWTGDSEGDAPGAARRLDLEAAREACEAVAATLDASSFVSVPFGFPHQASGRLFLTFGRPREFDRSEATFLSQAVDQAYPLLENIRLIDQLASTAAEEERRKIARDIHDSVIQPYVGLQMGLAALRQNLLARPGRDVAGDVERIIAMANSGVKDLRLHVSALRGEDAPASDLVPAVRRFAQRFSEATGIEVSVAAEQDVRVGGPIAAEAFQMVAEGLSNVRRHTETTVARIGLSCRDARLVVRIEDEGSGAGLETFTPRSISERAQSLGGQVTVTKRDDGGASVVVEIPL